MRLQSPLETKTTFKKSLSKYSLLVPSSTSRSVLTKRVFTPRPPTRSNENKVIQTIQHSNSFLKAPLKDSTVEGLKDFIIGESLGYGAYAKVNEALHIPTSSSVAIKTYDRSRLKKPHQVTRVLREIALMRKLEHPYIVKLYDFKETEHFIHLIIEHVKGCSLFTYLKQRSSRRLSEPEAKRITHQIIQAVDYLHNQSIAHKDIKLENVLIDERGNAKLIDFGFAMKFRDSKMCNVYCGTPSYMAPEILSKTEHVGTAPDVWAIGVILYTLLAGSFPFKADKDRKQHLVNICNKLRFPEHFSRESKRFIIKLLNEDYSLRPNSVELLADEYFTDRLITRDKSPFSVMFE